MTKDIADKVGQTLLRQSDVLVSFTYEYPGYLAIQTDGGGAWNIGTANGTYGADLYIDAQALIDGEAPDHSVDTGISAECTDSEQIAHALYRAMAMITDSEVPQC